MNSMEIMRSGLMDQQQRKGCREKPGISMNVAAMINSILSQSSQMKSTSLAEQHNMAFMLVNKA